MTTVGVGRRTLLTGLAATALSTPAISQARRGRAVVIGGGFAGATAARALKAGSLDVTLVERNESYVACPFSNEVIAGLRPYEGQVFGYEALAREGIALAREEVTAIDAPARMVRWQNGGSLAYDRLVLAPGIDLRFDALPGYTERAAEIMPHAWKAGAQTLLLRNRLAALDDGALIVMSVPANPYRCPPGPYERASLIAHYLKTHKPRAKLLVLDAKDVFSKQSLFLEGWKALYPNLEWVSLAQGGEVKEVDAAAGIVATDFERYRPALATIIPPQRAGAVAAMAGVADQTGWCPIDPATFESRRVPHIHVIGDAAIAGAMPKSAFAANAQAKHCAAVIVDLLAGRAPVETRLINTCYSLVAPDYGVSVAGVYRPGPSGLLADIEGAGGTSPLGAPGDVRALEARYAADWFRTITAEVFG